ncbi:MAG: RsmB/NOP family class I SAM-dependent RNA methyltransferase [Pseudomonadota bacterium]
MQLGGRLAAAIEILENIESRRLPVAQTLKDWGQANRFAGSADRAAIGNVVYDTLRHRSFLAAQMADPSPRAAVLAAMHWLPGYLDIGELDFDGDPYAPPPPTPAEQIAFQRGLPNAATPAQRANAPEWLWPSLTRVFGDFTEAEVGAFAARAPLDLRLNPLGSKPPRVDKALGRHKPLRDPAFPLLRRIPQSEGFQRTPQIVMEQAYQKGWVEVQDAGSQMMAEWAVAGMRIKTAFDLCAGAGGKTLALSAFQGGKGQIFAHDIDRKRMADLWPRVKRSGAHNIQIIDPDDLADHQITATGVDCVVVDAPCSGTGTWRRHPDTKWRLTEKSLQTRIAEQDTVLQQAAPFVKPGGRLVYITCSVLAEENEDRLVPFLSHHGDFRTLSAKDLQTNLARKTKPGFHPSIATAGFSVGDLGLRLTPLASGTDGFYLAVLERSKPS